MHDDDFELGFASLAVRAGQVRTFEGEHAEAIFPTSSFVFQNAAQAAARFAEQEPGNTRLSSFFSLDRIRTCCSCRHTSLRPIFQ